MAEQCGYGANVTMLLPCSGGSKCGQIAHRVALSLDMLGVGRLCSPAAISACLDEAMESARCAKKLVIIDGCAAACARKTVEHAGLQVTDWVCVTNEGVANSHSLLLDDQEVEPITFRIKDRLIGAASAEM
jgi:uncharacterized metal-binding protein